MTQERLYSRQTGKSVWVVLVVLVVLAALGAGGWWGWQQFQQMQKEKAGLAGQISELKAAMASQRSDVQGALSSFEKNRRSCPPVWSRIAPCSAICRVVGKHCGWSMRPGHWPAWPASDCC